MAMNRWKSLQRRFERQPELERDYCAAMAKTFEQGYASILPDPSNAKYFLAIMVSTRARNFGWFLTPPPPSGENVLMMQF